MVNNNAQACLWTVQVEMEYLEDLPDLALSDFTYFYIKETSGHKNFTNDYDEVK